MRLFQSNCVVMWSVAAARCRYLAILTPVEKQLALYTVQRYLAAPTESFATKKPPAFPANSKWSRRSIRLWALFSRVAEK